MRFIILFLVAAFTLTIAACDTDEPVVRVSYCKYKVTQHDRPETVRRPDPLLDVGGFICIRCTRGMDARSCSFARGETTYTHQYEVRGFEGSITLEMANGWKACQGCTTGIYDVSTEFESLGEVLANEAP